MSYLNPLLAYGLPRLAKHASRAGISGFIVPDLPHEESQGFHAECTTYGLALIPLITPITPPQRIQTLCEHARGFIYTVTRTGVTGGTTSLSTEAKEVLRRARHHAKVPVMAGFGVRHAAQVEALSHEADGVIVGSALVECIDQEQPIETYLQNLRPTPMAIGGVR
jgi:tryptophan synthase alpha chain